MASQFLALGPYPATSTETRLHWSSWSYNVPKVLEEVSFDSGHLLMLDFQNRWDLTRTQLEAPPWDCHLPIVAALHNWNYKGHNKHRPSGSFPSCSC